MTFHSLTIAYWCVLFAATLPYFITMVAKAGAFGSRDNQAPREWARQQAGWRARLMSAAANGFEGLPLFIGAVVIAHQLGYRQSAVDLCALAYLVLRIVYAGVYGAGVGALRSLVWGLALLANIALFFIGT